MGATSAATGSSPFVALGAAIGIIAAVAAIIVILLVIQRKRRQNQAEPKPRLTWSERFIARLAPVKLPEQDMEKGIELHSVFRPISTLPPLPAPRPYRKTRLSSIPENPFVVGDEEDDFEVLSMAPPQKAMPELRIRINRPGSPFSNEYTMTSPEVPVHWGKVLPRDSSDESRPSTSGRHS